MPVEQTLTLETSENTLFEKRSEEELLKINQLILSIKNKLLIFGYFLKTISYARAKCPALTCRVCYYGLDV